jgi:hypothetical protein
MGEVMQFRKFAAAQSVPLKHGAHAAVQKYEFRGKQCLQIQE